MRVLLYFMAAAITAGGLLAGGVAGAAAHELPEGFSGFADPAGCGSCHEAIYGEWKGSMHANSSKFKDPVHSAVHDAFSAAMETKGGGANYHCASCHTPTADNMAALMKGEAAPDPGNPTNVSGVTCSFCHMADAVVEGGKFNSYRVTEGIKGTSDESPAPHGAARWAFGSAYEMCLGCHGKKISGKGGVVCSMAEEGITDCIPCHMPKAGGGPAASSENDEHSFHGMHGGHRRDMLQKGAALALSSSDGRLTVTLTNPNPHYFPSTNPLRVAYVRVEAYDEAGEVIFTNFKEDPSEDPGAMLAKAFGAGEKVGVPSWEAEFVARDTRLKPGEERVIEYTLPEGARSAAAKLFYRLVPPRAMEKFNVAPDGFVEKPHLVSEAGIRL